MTPEKFDHWAILEIMGHQTYAGRVTNQELGGASFVRIDVPELPDKPAFTKLFGAGSIYAITLVSEDVARLRAAGLAKAPMDVWDFPDEIRDKVRGLLPRPQGVCWSQSDGDPDDDPDDEAI